MESDFSGGQPPRRKPKVIQPIEAPKRPSVHELAAREGHDLNAGDNAAGPEAEAALGFARDHTKPASEEVHSINPSIDINNGKDLPPIHEKPGRSKFAWLKYKLTKKQKIIALIAAAVLIVAAGVAAYEVDSHDKVQPLIETHSVIKPKPQPIYSPLTGLPVTKAQAEMPVTGVMIENSLPARPQSGLSQAGVVYEAIAEAGITRFLVLYQGEMPDNIGPVRSARPYFVRWDLGYDAPYAHVGGSNEALSDISQWNVKDLNQFYAGSYYHRITSRWAPHNVYTSMEDLHALEKTRGYYKTSDFTGFTRKKDAPAKKPNAATINMNISSSAYAVKYVYQPKDNDYERFEGGQPHIDASTNEPITPKVVVAMIIPFSNGSLDSSGAYYSVYNNVGSGSAYIFQDGTVTEGEWQKSSLAAPVKLVDGAGKPIALNRGQTWLTALANSGELTYSP